MIWNVISKVEISWYCSTVYNWIYVSYSIILAITIIMLVRVHYQRYLGFAQIKVSSIVTEMIKIKAIAPG